MKRELSLRGLVEGRARARILAYPGYISLYGEVDPETGVLKPLGETVAGRILVAYGTRGSTVGSYILYALAENGKAPAAIIVAEAEPILVAGAVLAATPLAAGIPKDDVKEIDGCTAELRVEPPEARLRITSCP